jgi:hypothetical protein
MLYCVAVGEFPGGNPHIVPITYRYVGSDGKLKDDPADGRKYSTMAEAEIAIIGCGLVDAVIKEVCKGNAYDRLSVVLDRTKAIDAGTPTTNGMVGKHVETKP